MIICIAGPSSIGKTKLSIKLAQKYNAIIINADATQVYSELNIGSAKIKQSEKEGVEHFLLDIRTPDEDYSVSDYQKDARQIIDDNQDKNIIVVGGTGLYLKSLFYDYQFTEKSKESFDHLSNEKLYALALKKDKKIDIHPNNRIRLINFLQKENTSVVEPKLLYDVIFIGLTMDREEIYNRINKRVDEMLEEGLLTEVKDLNNKYPNSNILKRAIGYKELISYLNNEISFPQAIDSIKKNSRHYVKRQYTWFNNQMDLNWFNVDKDNFDKTVYEIISFIDSLNSK